MEFVVEAGYNLRLLSFGYMPNTLDTYAGEVMRKLPGTEWAGDAVSRFIQSADPNSGKSLSSFYLNLLIDGVPITVIALVNGSIAYVVGGARLAYEKVFQPHTK